jgi:hypothetical protein
MIVTKSILILERWILISERAITLTTSEGFLKNTLIINPKQQEFQIHSSHKILIHVLRSNLSLAQDLIR